MVWWAAALWGLLGAGLVEAFDLYPEVRRRRALPWRERGSRRRDPARPSARIYTLASSLRMVMGTGVAAAAGASNMITIPPVAVTVGIAAPLIIDRMTKQMPLSLPDASPRSPNGRSGRTVRSPIFSRSCPGAGSCTRVSP
ncbi:MAG: hypothetical protein ACT4RN_09450 [Pseudonocardia sp.]